MENILSLLSGSDVRGTNDKLTAEISYNIAKGFSKWLGSKKTIALGRDCRLNGEELLESFAKGLIDSGNDVIDFGMATTPAMFMSLILYKKVKIDSSVMITASHLPCNWNGIKFFNKDGGLESTDVRKILEYASTFGTPCLKNNYSINSDKSLIPLYTGYLRQKIGTNLNGLHIVIDAGNGCAGFFAKILEDLGADITGSLFLTPNGSFPNHIPNPENTDAINSIKNAVINNHADLGLIFDTDVDRMSCVFSDGTEVNRDSIIALVAAIIAPGNNNATIVTDSVTSRRLTRFLRSLGYKHLCYKRGYKNVIDKMKELDNCPLAMETSGHGALAENYYLDDGAYLACKIVNALNKCKNEGKNLSDLISGLENLIEEDNKRIKITAADFVSYGKNVLQTFKERATQKGYTIAPGFEGVRLEFNDSPRGWILLRMSLHEAVMPLNIESEHAGDITKLLDIAKDLLSGFSELQF